MYENNIIEIYKIMMFFLLSLDYKWIIYLVVYNGFKIEIFFVLRDNFDYLESGSFIRFFFSLLNKMLKCSFFKVFLRDYMMCSEVLVEFVYLWFNVLKKKMYWN